MKIINTSLLSITMLVSPVYADTHLKQKAAASKKVVKEFVGQLQGELKSAMKSGGPLKAISVCKDTAPSIANELSEKYGWDIARTSLKTRNPSNVPDAWETKVLEEFETRKKAGEAVKPMAYFSEVEESGVKSFRFMKAIPTGKPCLACHGDNISPGIQAKLNEEYPSDMARGFKLGDIRGAFTITQPIK